MGLGKCFMHAVLRSKVKVTERSCRCEKYCYRDPWKTACWILMKLRIYNLYTKAACWKSFHEIWTKVKVIFKIKLLHRTANAQFYCHVWFSDFIRSLSESYHFIYIYVTQQQGELISFMPVLGQRPTSQTSLMEPFCTAITLCFGNYSATWRVMIMIYM